jgi:outer membrane protein
VKVKNVVKHKVLFLLFSFLCKSAAAQSAGDTLVTVGGAWLDFANSSAGNLVSSSAFGTYSSQTSAEVHNAATAGLVVTHFITDNIAVEGVIAYPPTLDIFAQGNAAPLGGRGPQMPLGGMQPLASTRTWPATVLLKYSFGGAAQKLRPFVGVGANYTWYTNIQLNPAFASAAQTFAGPGGSVHSSLSPSWNPVVSAGFSYALSEHWYAMGSVMYFPLKTDATITSVAANGVTTMTNKLHVNANPVIAFAGIGYRF